MKGPSSKFVFVNALRSHCLKRYDYNGTESQERMSQSSSLDSHEVYAFISKLKVAS
jgi:hypothetical protein